MGSTILIVDDNPQLRVLIRRILSQESTLQVVGEAGDGAEAIRLAHILRPDIVLMDLVMPQVNGLEAMQRIKMERPETKVIIITMHAEDVYRRTAEANGSDVFLLKKNLMTALLPAIQSVCSSMSPPTPP